MTSVLFSAGGLQLGFAPVPFESEKTTEKKLITRNRVRA